MMMSSGSPFTAWNAAPSSIPPPPGLVASAPQAANASADHCYPGPNVHRLGNVHNKGPGVAMRATETLSTVADDTCSTKSGGSGKSCLSGHRPSLPSVEFDSEPHVQEVSKSITTLMVRNIPAMVTQEMLYKQWTNTTGFTFNFLYLPKSSADLATNMGFAFVNFLSEEDAMAFKEFWHKRRLIGSTARKPLNISAADVQGLRLNIIQLVKKRNPCLEVQECQPIIIRHGEFISLEQARKAIATSQV
eukprot:CAMPEP_0206521370 /NCGR_PEP_ID=MMETSP0324_2-20121206/66284_1 /ASSEMBLY_ACC=CAM_ASM_000836 /TAXON_ID=2866 /ORGANISM="Crypthecodinium cohnii, Strain Seligo" /LENGTH=246 /DNA_ID=CAMNT_0054015205 /DNA_START=89 /DNA_END=827 /DNA_ORIENTATION=+